jgi:hypothetical protein
VGCLAKYGIACSDGASDTALFVVAPSVYAAVADALLGGLQEQLAQFNNALLEQEE